MAADAGALTAASLSLGQTVTAYTFFLPPLREVRQAGADNATIRGDVRMGQVAAGALSIGVAAIMSSLTSSTLPIVVSFIVAIIIAFMYETALRRERLFEQ